MANEERVVFSSGRGQKLVGILHHLAGHEPQAAVILCHGMKSNREYHFQTPYTDLASVCRYHYSYAKFLTLDNGLEKNRVLENYFRR